MKKRKPPKSRLGRKRGEYWYELVDYFDPDKIVRASPDDRVFIMGKLNEPDIVVVEVPDESSDEKIQQLGEWLSSQGVHALIVRANMRFLRMRRASDSQTRVLDDHLRRDQTAEKQSVARAAETLSEE